MTPKEKSKKLTDDYINIMPCLTKQTGHAIKEHAKQCALICVDEIVKALPYNQIPKFIFWSEVEDEIKKL